MRRARPLTLAAAASLLMLRTAAASPAQDYMLYCMGCHGETAQGVAGKVPRLAGNLPLYMRTPAGRNYVLRVPGAANSVLSDEGITAVLNWLAATYPAANVAPPQPFTLAEVSAARHTPLANVQETRQQVVRALAASGPAPATEY
jgi:cytochrome c553